MSTILQPVVIKAGKQGPPGPRGEPGPPGDGSGGALTPESIGALSAAARLAEFDNEEKKAAARENIGLTVIDGGQFF